MNRVFFAASCLLVALAAACGGGGGTENDDGSSPSATATRNPNSGPSIALEPKSGPPGIDVTATGTGWPAGVEVIITGVAAGQPPYTTAVTDRSGGFRATFFLEEKPDGSALETGRLDIIASSGDVSVTVPYVVQTRRPVSGPGPGGG